MSEEKGMYLATGVLKYRKKPVVIEAMRFTGDNWADIMYWAHKGCPPEMNAIILRDIHGLRVRTLEGIMIASLGDWIIKGVKGEFYPCKNDIFEATYELA